MPLDLLQRLAQSPLPCMLHDADDIVKLAVLEDAGLLVASFVRWRDPTQLRVATLHGFTAAGLSMQRRLARARDEAVEADLAPAPTWTPPLAPVQTQPLVQMHRPTLPHSHSISHAHAHAHAHARAPAARA